MRTDPNNAISRLVAILVALGIAIPSHGQSSQVNSAASTAPGDDDDEKKKSSADKKGDDDDKDRDNDNDEKKKEKKSSGDKKSNDDDKKKSSSSKKGDGDDDRDVRKQKKKEKEEERRKLRQERRDKKRAKAARDKASADTVIYYVKPTGNDAKNGLSMDNAFRTIQKAVNTVTRPGTTIYVAPGSYNETVTLPSNVKSGSQNKPVRLIGDELGVFTGSVEGGVVIDGQGVRQHGILINGGSHWSFQGLTIQGQTNANIYSGRSKISDMEFDSCTLAVAPTWGVYFADCGNFTLTDNEFLRSPTSGHVSYIYQTSGSAMTITGNWLNMTGDAFRSTVYKSGTFASSTNRGNSTYSYGIVAMAANTGAITMTIKNNVVSDAYLGIYAYCYSTGSKSALNISNNTAVGCYYPLYIYATRNAVGTITNNIAGDSYITPYISIPNGVIDGLLTYGSTYNPCRTGSADSCGWITAPKMSNIIFDQTPTFADAREGDFSLTGSVGIDQGTPLGAPDVDIAGAARPVDGDGNGSADIDLGAFESSLQATRKVRVLKWKESGISD